MNAKPPKPPTIWQALTEKLGREPTNQEARDEVRRTQDEALVDRAEKGALPHQRRRRRR